MFVVAVVVSLLLALTLFASAAMWFKQLPDVLATADRLGLPRWSLRWLALAKTLGGIGVIVGLWVEALGVAAATGVVLYFVLATIGHLRVRDYHGASHPVIPLVLGLATLVLRVATL